MKKGKEIELGRKWGATGLGGLLSTLPGQPSQHSCSPILGTHHVPASVRRRVFLSTACIINIYLPVIREVPISFIV